MNPGPAEDQVQISPRAWAECVAIEWLSLLLLGQWRNRVLAGNREVITTGDLHKRVEAVAP